MRIRAIVLAVGLAQGGAATAQVAHSAGISPSPVLPPSGQPNQEGQFVYLGPTVHELTLFYPMRGPDGRLLGYSKAVRVPLVNGVAPDISTEVRRNSDGRFSYRFIVANLPEARQAIRHWSLPVRAGVGAVAAPAGWQWAADGPTEASYRPQGPEEMTPLRRRVTVSWSTTRPVAPGASQGGFTIVSEFAPALVQAFARAGDLQVPDDLPEEVRKQLEVWQAPEWRDRSVWIIGPRYPANFPRTVAANEFATIMSLMASQRQLDPDSRFVREAMVQLRALAAGEAPFPANLAFAALAVTPKEKQLAEAIRLTLSSQ
jgi:hypothetical protein